MRESFILLLSAALLMGVSLEAPSIPFAEERDRNEESKIRLVGKLPGKDPSGNPVEKMIDKTCYLDTANIILRKKDAAGKRDCPLLCHMGITCLREVEKEGAKLTLLYGDSMACKAVNETTCPSAHHCYFNDLDTWPSKTIEVIESDGSGARKIPPRILIRDKVHNSNVNELLKGGGN